MVEITHFAHGNEMPTCGSFEFIAVDSFLKGKHTRLLSLSGNARVRVNMRTDLRRPEKHTILAEMTP